MANTNPQAIAISDQHMRPLADKFAQLYNLCKAEQANAVANGWTTLFPADGAAIGDSSSTDGRNPITDTDINNLIAMVTTFINYMEATSFANRNLVNKISVNPTRY